MRSRVLVAVPLVLVLSGCAGLPGAGTKAVQSSTPMPLAFTRSFSCTDRTGGHGGKEFASPPQVKSLTADRRDGVDRLVFDFPPGPNGPDLVPTYSISQRFEPQFVRTNPQETVTLLG